MRNVFFCFWMCFLLACHGANTDIPAKETRTQVLEAPPSESGSDRLIVAFGDSLTAGSGVPQDLSYPAALQRLLKDRSPSCRVINAGIGGETSSEALSRLQSIIEMKPRIVILELGANDGLRGVPLAMIRKNLDAMITRLQTAGIQVVLAGMRIPPNYGTEYTQGFHQIYVDLASEHHLVLIPFFLENVAGIPELNLEDGIHPTPEGYRIIAKQVLQVIEPLLGLSSPQRHSAAEPQPRIRCFRLAA